MTTMKKAKVKPASWVLSLKLKQEIETAMRAFIESHEFQPTLTSVIEKAFIEFLERRGFWPPPTKRE